MLENLETDAEEQRKQQLDATDAWKHLGHWLSLVLNMFLSFSGDVYDFYFFLNFG